MAIILGLDVSTACTGYCVLNSLAPAGECYLLDRVDFKGCKTLWDKADAVNDAFKNMRDVLGIKVDRIVLEEALLGFRPGMSSAVTISTLMRFNGIVSYMARNVFNKEPEYIGSAHARKLCGIKLQRTAIGGPQKAQVFKHMSEHDLKDVTWPLKKSGKIVDWATDACDAYVIARAAAINGPIVVTKKAKKVPKPPGGCAYPCDPPCSGRPMRGLMMCHKHQPFPA